MKKLGFRCRLKASHFKIKNEEIGGANITFLLKIKLINT